LRGRVLQVGGLREKALAAHRAGFRSMLYPAANEKDLDEVPKDVREKLELVPVETMDDVFAVALHRVIVPQRVAGNFIIEVEDDEGGAGDGPQAPGEDMRAARGRKR
jgi:predicted ATP-dependent protease